MTKRDEQVEDRCHDVSTCIEAQPLITREKIALYLNLNIRTVRRYVIRLMAAGKVVEADLPREPGQSGPPLHGLVMREKTS